MKYTVVFIALTIFLIFYTIFGHNGILKFIEMSKIKSEYENKTEDLGKRITFIEKELDMISKDNEYLEFLIRKDIGMQKEGEDVYILDKNVYRLDNLTSDGN